VSFSITHKVRPKLESRRAKVDAGPTTGLRSPCRCWPNGNPARGWVRSR